MSPRQIFGLILVGIGAIIGIFIFSKVKTVLGVRYIGDVNTGTLIPDGTFIAIWIVIVILILGGAAMLFVQNSEKSND